MGEDGWLNFSEIGNKYVKENISGYSGEKEVLLKFSGSNFGSKVKVISVGRLLVQK